MSINVNERQDNTTPEILMVALGLCFSRRLLRQGINHLTDELLR